MKLYFFALKVFYLDIEVKVENFFNRKSQKVYVEVTDP